MMEYSPTIISCSRATDIPAFFAEEFAECLERGFVDKYNSYTENYDRIRFDKCRLIVFWSKNPAPIIPYLSLLDKKGIHYYFQYTLNAYGKEIEPDVPSLEERIETFHRLSGRLCPDAVNWRYDPILITPSIGMDWHIDRIRKIHSLLGERVSRLTFSFIDVDKYIRVGKNIESAGITLCPIGPVEMYYFASRLQDLNRQMNLELFTCAEKIDLDKYGITHAQCIDDRLIARLFSTDKALMRTVGKTIRTVDLFGHVIEKTSYKKDPGQRRLCGCITSKDIGRYNTCNHGCVYCYATAHKPQKPVGADGRTCMWPVQPDPEKKRKQTP